MCRLLFCLLFATHACGQWTGSRIQGRPEPPRPMVAEQVFHSLSFNQALEMVAVPGVRRFVAVEDKGKVWTFPQDPKTAEKTLLIDLKALQPELTHGYGVAFHPRWRENGYVFLTYTLREKLEDGSRLSRFKLAQMEPPVLDPGSETVVLTWLSGGHNGACIHFGPDGMLYLSTGDGTAPSPPDSLNTGQGVNDLLSCVLRVDVDRAEAGRPYGIPADNPFVGTPGARPEIWAFGFRNPWKISFDAKGRLWCGDVGWELWE
ncbi:MAG: PQQ-dependent sugar dehydrogenase, partial [Prosthecobacter sp.]|nr:PQQ-dependent sugar dehydrogenase [Prosthecobacter sp.]